MSDTGACASATRCSISAGRPISPPKSRSSPYAASRWTRRSCSPICCCRSSRWASAFDFVQGEGPAIEKPLRSEADLARVRRFEPREQLGYVLDAIRQIKRALGGRVPLIGFAGAPFTLASYAIEGGHSSNFAHTKALMYGAPGRVAPLLRLLADVVGEYLVAQIEAGVDAVQVFDSWVGALNAADYREFILPHTQTIFERLAGARRADDPLRRRHRRRFWRAARRRRRRDRRRLAHAARRGVGAHRHRTARIQGNLDPTLLLGPLDRVFAATDEVLERARRPPRTHLQSRARHPADDAARTRSGARAIRAPEDAIVTGFGIGIRDSRGTRWRHVARESASRFTKRESRISPGLMSRRSPDGPRHPVLARRDAGST